MKSVYILFAACFLFAGCATTPQDQAETEKEDLSVQVHEEVGVGREMAAKLYGHFGKYAAEPKLAEYVGLVGSSIAASAGRPELRFHFGILDTDEVNAFATPGGYVFITRGLLLQIHSEAELAGILAHEIAHVNEKHMYLRIVPKHEVSAQESVARIMSRGRSDLGKSLTLLADKGLQLLIDGGLGKDKEAEADQEALVTIAWLGYDPNAFVGLLQRLEANSGNLKFGKIAQALPERISALDAYIKSNGINNRKVADNAVLEKRFASAWGKLAQK